MSLIRVISDNQVKKILDIRNTIKYVEKSYELKAKKEARVFSMISEEIFEGTAEMDIKSGMLSEENIFGLKLVSWFGNNTKKGLPAINGLNMVFDLENGMPKAIINASYLTGMRTGAAGAIGIKYLAKKNLSELLVVGTGRQAIFQIAATLSEIESINKVYIYNPINIESAKKFKNDIKLELSEIINNINDLENIAWKRRIELVEFIVLENIEEAVKSVDAIITITPSRKAMIKDEWIKEGTHLSCVGTDMEGKQEIDQKIFKRSIVFSDDVNQAIKFGETQHAINDGLIDRKSINEIGDLILNNAKGRNSNKDITIFDSTGIALQDIAVSKYVLLKAEEMNIGKLIEI